MFWPAGRNDGFPRWLLVGTGRSESKAVVDLRDKMQASAPPRWRVKLETRDENRKARQASVAQVPDNYVVPWQIGVDDDVLGAELAASGSYYG